MTDLIWILLGAGLFMGLMAAVILGGVWFWRKWDDQVTGGDPQ